MNKLEVFPIGKIQNGEDGTFVELDPKYIPALTALEGFSHINVFWWFSECDNAECRSALQTPKPYKTAPEIMGTFATRSPMRPNPIALTTAEVIFIDHEKGRIQIAYTDANDGTPVLDIKPYTPSLDRVEHPSVPEWCSHWPMSLEQSAEFPWEDVFNY
jgi:tRNA-Thr(GGU) m(6)t(6)A37 methyltransferase TsaA